MIIGDGEAHPPHPMHQKKLALVTIALLIALVTGAGGYLLGVQTRLVSPFIPVLPTPIPALTANWKTYSNAEWGVSFKYPDRWFFKKRQGSNQAGFIFYPNWVTPSVVYESYGVVKVGEEQSQQSTEQFIKTGGSRVVMVDEKPAVTDGKWWYFIKLSNTRELFFTAINDVGSKELGTIVSTMKFTDQPGVSSSPR